MKKSTSAMPGLGRTAPLPLVDYRTNLVDEWVMNRGIVINVSNTAVEYLNGQNGNYRLNVSGNKLTTNNEIELTTLGDGFTNAFDTEITPGYGFTGDITFVLYVKKAAAHSAIQILFDSANSNSSTNPLFQFQTQISGANLNMQFSYNAVNYPLTGQTFPYDSDYHVVLVRIRNDAGTIKGSVVIDGTQRGSEQSFTGSMTNWDAKIARRYLRSSSTTWFGFVKRIRVYKEWVNDTNAQFLSNTGAVFKRDEADTRTEVVIAGKGQSNWEGEPCATTAGLTPSDRQLPISRTNFFSNFSARVLTGTVLSEVRPTNGPGPLIELAYQVRAKYDNNNFYVISVALSNTGYASYWNSRTSGTGWLEYSRQVTNLLMKLKAEGRTISEVWLPDNLGENDASNTTDAGNFATNAGNFFDDITAIITGIFPSATIKVAAARINLNLSIVSYPGRDTVRTGLATIASTRPYINIINIDDLSLAAGCGDLTHYSTTQLQTIGARMAAVL